MSAVSGHQAGGLQLIYRTLKADQSVAVDLNGKMPGANIRQRSQNEIMCVYDYFNG